MTTEDSLPEDESQLHSNWTCRVGFAGGGAVRRPRSAPILLRSPWKDGQRGHFPGKAAEGHGFVLVRRIFGILHLLDGAAAHDVAHFT